MYFNNEPTNQAESINISLSNRQASLLLAAGMLIIFFSFITGYFWGKRNAISQFCMGVEQSSFADRIYTSMCELSETEVPTTQDTVTASADSAAITAVDADDGTDGEEPVSALGQDLQGEQVGAVAAAVPADATPTVSYHAQLAGYGSQQHAEKFVQKLRKKGVAASVETRNSKSAKGKTRSWYQVVTKDFTNKNELEVLVARISKEEKLSGVRITRS